MEHYGNAKARNNRLPFRSPVKRLRSLREWCMRQWSALPSALRKALIVFIVMRVTASVAGIIGISTIPSNPIAATEQYSKPLYIKGYEEVFGIWERSDALWYIHIARDGYGKTGGSAAFFPFYPLLIKAVHTVTRLPWLAAALLISNTALVWALYYIYCIAEKEHGSEAAERAIWYQMLYPGSIFLLAPYPEPLFLCLAAGAFHAAQKRRWWCAGLCGFLISMTRSTGVLIIIPLIVEFLQARKKERSFHAAESLWLLLTPLGLAAVMLFWKIISGDGLAFLHAQTGWSRSFTAPWITLWEGMKQGITAPVQYPWGVYIFEILAVAALIILALLSLRIIPLSQSLYIWLMILPAWCFPYDGNYFLSNIRFLSILFPAAITIAVLAKRRDVDMAFRTVLASLYGIAAALYVTSQNMF
ncbi:MAG: hypothetical protein AB9903_28830 [Vulcanimicrobiota bacterium]